MADTGASVDMRAQDLAVVIVSRSGCLCVFTCVSAGEISGF